MKRKILFHVLMFCLIFFFASAIFAQNRGARVPQSMQERLSIGFSNPAKEKTVSVSWQTGHVKINGYNGDEVQVELYEIQDGKLPPKIETGETNRAGLKLYNTPSGDIRVYESSNTIYVTSGSRKPEINTNIIVPNNVILKVKSNKSGLIHIENMKGELEITNSNGDIILNSVSGAILVSSYAGKINAVINGFSTDKPSSFSSQSDDIDITLPSNTKTSFILNVREGDIYSDFNIEMKSAWEKREDRRSSNFRRITKGDINGGGAEVKVTSNSGNLIVRKGR